MFVSITFKKFHVLDSYIQLKLSINYSIMSIFNKISGELLASQFYKFNFKKIGLVMLMEWKSTKLLILYVRLICKLYIWKVTFSYAV